MEERLTRREMRAMRESERPRRPTQRASAEILLNQLREDVKALNSAISIVSQKMRHVTRNEKILGRNLIVLNKKIKEFSERGSGAVPEGMDTQMKEFSLQLREVSAQIDELRAEINHLKESSVSSEKLAEIKYVVDSINPSEMATIEQVKEMIDERLKKAK